MTTIYTITNTVTHRTYVGKTSVLPAHRVQKHFEALRSRRHKVEQFQDDFNQYGENSFVVNFLDGYDDHEGARMEAFTMKILRSQDRRYGYNYKDKLGTGKNAISDKWRTPPIAWRMCYRQEAT